MEQRNFEIKLSQLINKGLENLLKEEGVKDVIKNMFNAHKINNEDLIAIYQDTLSGLVAESICKVDEIEDFWKDYINGKESNEIPVRLDVRAMIATHDYMAGVQTAIMNLDVLYLKMVGSLQVHVDSIYAYSKIPFYKDSHEQASYYIGVDESNVEVYNYMSDEEDEKDNNEGFEGDDFND